MFLCILYEILYSFVHPLIKKHAPSYLNLDFAFLKKARSAHLYPISNEMKRNFHIFRDESSTWAAITI